MPSPLRASRTAFYLSAARKSTNACESVRPARAATAETCGTDIRAEKKSRQACGPSLAAPFQAGTPYSLGCGQYHRCEELNYRVRNGNGCFLSTLGTRNFKVSCPQARDTILLEFQRYCLARHCTPCRLFTLFMKATPCKQELARSFPTSRRMPGLHGNESGQANR